MRSQRGIVWPFLLLSVALLGALGFGWVQTRQKNKLALDAENKYMSAFHKLKWTSENIEERTARLMATNDRELQRNLLADLRVYSAQSVDNMATLPFLTSNTPQIESFLKTLRDRSDEYHYKLSQGLPLSEQEWTTLVELRRQSVSFESELGNLLGLVGSNMIRWGDTVRVTGPAQSGAADTPITRSVAQLEKALKAPPGQENALSPQASPMARPKMDPGAPVDPGTAAAAIKRFVDMPLNGEPALTGRSDPADQLHEFSLYFFDAKKANGTPLNFGVSIHGGHIIYMIDGRQVTEKRFSVPQLAERARDMLKRRGYPDVRLVSAAENDGTLVMDFAPVEQGVAVHIDSIKVMLAMDNAELVGFDARSYWLNRQPRNLGTPAVSSADARGRVSPRLTVVSDPHLAVIADQRRNERLVWEFLGKIDTQHYRVFIDAMSGREVDVLRIEGDPAPPQ